MPRVSVLLPVRNAATTLPAALDSLRDQSLSDWELVAVDDGSSDTTPDLLHHAATRDARIRLLSTPPRGIAAALITGTAACRAPLIARFDADDLMHPDRLHLQATFLDQHPDVGLVSCGVRYGGSSPGYAAHVDWLNQLETPELLHLRRFIDAPVAHPSVVFRSHLLTDHGGYQDGPFPEDHELWLRWLEAGVRFAKVPDELLTWNDPPSRLSRTDPRYAPDRFHTMKRPYLLRALRSVLHGRSLWLWGAGRLARRRFGGLTNHGLPLAGFIDVDPRKTNRTLSDLPIRDYRDLPDPGSSFILSVVHNRGARDLIHAHLTAHGWHEGADFLQA